MANKKKEDTGVTNIDEVCEIMKQSLRDRGLDTPLNFRRVEEYKEYAIIKKALIEDIEKYGVRQCVGETKNGEPIYKKNDRISELTKIDNMMNKIPYDLGMRARDLKDKDVGIEL